MRSWSRCSPSCCPQFPDVEAVNLGGGIPHPYRPGAPTLRPRLVPPACSSRRRRALAKAAGRPIRVEIEPGRYPVAATGLLVARVKDIKETASQREGPGPPLRHGRRRLQRPGAAGDVRLVPPHLDRRRRRGARARAVRRRRARCARAATSSRATTTSCSTRARSASRGRRSAGAARRGRLRRRDELELRLDRPRAAGLLGRRQRDA